MVDLLNIDWTLKYQGAESKIWFGVYSDKRVVKKERFAKTYRNEILDKRLTKERIKAELRAFKKLNEKCKEISSILPSILFNDDKNIIMTEVIESKTLGDCISEMNANGEDFTFILKEIGKVIGKIHSTGIVHGDLTTSNFLINKDMQVIPIDFGLSSSTVKAEDRAVDLYVFERSLEMLRACNGEHFEIILNEYLNEIGEKANDVKTKLNEVRLRGRKRSMVG